MHQVDFSLSHKSSLKDIPNVPVADSSSFLILLILCVAQGIFESSEEHIQLFSPDQPLSIFRMQPYIWSTPTAVHSSYPWIVGILGYVHLPQFMTDNIDSLSKVDGREILVGTYRDN